MDPSARSGFALTALLSFSLLFFSAISVGKLSMHAIPLSQVAAVGANTGNGVTLSVRISNEINCESDPQTNVYFDITPLDGGEVAVDDVGLIRKFDAAGSYEEGGLDGYFGNGTYQGALIPKTGFVLAQAAGFAFTVNSQCDVSGNPIIAATSTPMPVVVAPKPPLATTTTTTKVTAPKVPIVEPVPATTAVTTPTPTPTNETTAPENQIATTEVVPTVSSCTNETDCAKLCTIDAKSGENSCASFAATLVVSVPLSSMSTEELANMPTGTLMETLFEARSGARSFIDTDTDGVTDFDEVNVYGTDPKKADTNGNGIADSAELISHTDPLRPSSASATPIVFEDPNTYGKIASTTLIVSTIIPGATSTDANGVGHIASLTISGKAPANSFVTLFIYSEPVVVTMKADDSGSWIYTLDTELPDGKHEVISTITDNGGRVLVKSEPLPFVQTAYAITIGSSVVLPQVEQAPSFFGTTSVITMVSFLALILVLVLFVLGLVARRSKDDDAGTPTAA